jgi:hypothetical protein
LGWGLYKFNTGDGDWGLGIGDWVVIVPAKLQSEIPIKNSIISQIPLIKIII